MGATDLTRDINSSLSSQAITNDLQELKESLQEINKYHKEIDDSVKFKLKKIYKLDIL